MIWICRRRRVTMRAHLALVLPVEVQPGQTASRHVLSPTPRNMRSNIFNRKLRPYWQRNHETVETMLAQAEAEYSPLEARGRNTTTN